jgi:hypothetical protein
LSVVMLKGFLSVPCASRERSERARYKDLEPNQNLSLAEHAKIAEKIKNEIKALRFNQKKRLLLLF